MKKFLNILIVVLIVFSLTSCFSHDKLTNDYVYTTIYPTYYLTNYLYGSEKQVASIYPTGADIHTYELTAKQKENYHKGALFVYNGLTTEKELAREFLNDNEEILLIDVAYGLNYKYSIEELWLAPNYYLMLAKNIKNNLIDYTTSKTIAETIENKYKELEETLSYMDADLRSIASNAAKEGTNSIVVSSNKLKFLENYGFNVVVLNDESVTDATIKSNFNSKRYKDIYLCDNDEKTDLIAELEEKYNAQVINVKTMYTLTDKEVADGEDYLTIMKDFIENIRNTALS